MPVDEPATVDAQEPGAAFREAREAAGLSIPEVAQRLKLTVRLIEAIEANDRQRFPPAVYLRGFVRNYAKLLDLEAEPLLEAYALEKPAAAHWGEAKPGQTHSDFLSRLSIAGYPPVLVVSVAGGLVALVLVALVAWLWRAGEAPDPRNAAAATSSIESASVAGRERSEAEAGGASRIEPAAAEPAPGRAVATGERGPASGAAGVPDTAGSPAVEPDGLTARPEPATEAAAGGIEPDAAASDTPVSGDDVFGGYSQAPGTGDFVGDADDRFSFSRLTPTGDEELMFEFTEDCWVEVFDTEGETLYQDLMRRGQGVRLVGAGPFQIRLGYAPGVTLAYNGEPVPLAPHTRNNVALLVVGQ